MNACHQDPATSMPKASGGDISCCSRCTGKQRSVYRFPGVIFGAVDGLRAHIWNIFNSGVIAVKGQWPGKAGRDTEWLSIEVV